MEQTLIKEQIIGVWRNGDYWVSFDGNGREHVEGEPFVFSGTGDPYYYNGYCRAFLKIGDTEKSYAHKYTIKGNVISIVGLMGTLEVFTITHLDDSYISFVVKGRQDIEPFSPYSETMTFWKTNEDLSAM